MKITKSEEKCIDFKKIVRGCHIISIWLSLLFLNAYLSETVFREAMDMSRGEHKKKGYDIIGRVKRPPHICLIEIVWYIYRDRYRYIVLKNSNPGATYGGVTCWQGLVHK